MSTRLGLALHDVADAAADASAFGDPDDGTTVATVQRLASRVRRRRATRAAGTVTVAASVAGAVALVGPQLTADLSPAADPDADPGTCRSSVATLPSGTADDVLDVDLGFAAADGRETIGGPGNDGGVGAWQSDSIDLLVAVSELPAATTDPSRLRFLVTRKEVVVATAQQPVDRTATPSGQVLTELYGGSPPAAADPGTALHALRGSETLWAQALVDGGLGPLAQRTPMGLTACDGSGPLLPGDYDVWVTAVDAAGTAHGAAGPWELTVAAADARLTGRLPDGFPRDVPLVGGRLVAAHPHGAGWAAEVATPGEDRGRVAWERLVQAQAESHGDDLVTPVPDPLSGAIPWDGYDVGDWLVDAIPSRTADGEPSVVYILRPRPDLGP